MAVESPDVARALGVRRISVKASNPADFYLFNATKRLFSVTCAFASSSDRVCCSDT
ncbi:hypothetical protein BN2475_140046 [Paraburkholderia ribeironis]|uniref:Uncharacterized protein n=1 Tax=Paraburkholderia ribeironis TaxID=1247936 RepID=A0A1N7RST0_9BURK|nr:hypothetical protein BN2475_140046 [Paraburkholderia ribeironis]